MVTALKQGVSDDHAAQAVSGYHSRAGSGHPASAPSATDCGRAESPIRGEVGGLPAYLARRRLCRQQRAKHQIGTCVSRGETREAGSPALAPQSSLTKVRVTAHADRATASSEAIRPCQLRWNRAVSSSRWTRVFRASSASQWMGDRSHLTPWAFTKGPVGFSTIVNVCPTEADIRWR